jgi:hypothetical protein
MSFCTITPTRNDRPELLEFCKVQLDRMTVKPDQSYFIDYPPINGKFDLVSRVKQGVEQAKKDGHKYAFIIENDDWYSSDYFKSVQFYMDKGIDFIGSSSTIYYNLRNKTHQTFDHPGRSSLFMTGFRLEAMEGFAWPRAETVFLDLEIWRHAKRFSRYLTDKPLAVGIKHGIGLTGGKAHRMVMKHSDVHHGYLKSVVDPEAFRFYLTLVR